MKQGRPSGHHMDFKAFEATPGVNLVIAPDRPVYTIVAVSNDFVSLTGLRREDLVGKSHLQFFSATPDDSQRHAELLLNASFEEVITHRKPDAIDRVRFDINLDGAFMRRHWSVKNAPILDESGNVLYIVHAVTDISDRVEAEQSLESVKSMEKAYRFFMDAPVIIGYVCGNDYTIEFANEGLLKVWGRGAEVIGRPLFEAIPELQGQGVRHLLDEVRSTGKPYFSYGHPLVLHRNGREETLYFDFVYQPFYEDDKKTAHGVISVGYDVTPQVHAKELVAESQKKWRQLADTMPAIVWTADPEGSIDFLNQRWYEYTGLTEAESIGSGWLKVVHPDDVDHCMQAWRKALKEKTFYEIELRYRNSGGTYRWILARGVPIREDDKVIAWYGTSSDIDEQKQLERHLEVKVRERTLELEEKNKLLDNILTHSSNGISVTEMIFDEEGDVVDARTILANNAAVNFSGIPRELYLSKTASELDPGIVKSPYGQMCVQVLKTGKPSIIQYFLEFSSRWLELTVSRMDESHLIHIFTDVTPIKEAQLQLERSLEELKYANANMEEFAYATSHDLKEPVRKMQYFTNRLREELTEAIDAPQAKLFDRLENASVRMNKLIDDLLEYSQAARGSTQVEEIDLNEKVEGVLDDLELEVQQKKARVQVEHLPRIRGSRRQIQQLLQNLIGNALKYTKADVTPEIKITYRKVMGKETGRQLPPEAMDRCFHEIAVVDNGVGFDQRDADRIFTVFTRLHSHKEFPGSGIGLSIVKKVVDGHHGFVWAESERGEGSTFTVLLPV